MNVTPGIVALLGGLAVFLFFYSIYSPKKVIKKDDISEQFFADNNADFGSESSAFDRYIRPALRNFLPQSPLSASLKDEQRTKIEQLLIRSGNPWGIRPEEYTGLQIFFAFVGFFLGLVLGVLGVIPLIPPVLLIVLTTVAGYIWVGSFHNSKRESRSKEIQRQLPEALDLLVVTLASGQNFEPALESVTRRLPQGLLREELDKVSKEIRAGRSLERALLAFANRAANEEAESFAKAVAQAQHLGSDVSETLSNQAAAARRNYEALLERKTARLNTTMFVPLILTMLPALLLIFLAPVVSNLTGGFL